MLSPLLHDRMTQCQYDQPPETFSSAHSPQPVHFVDVIGEGRPALVRANTELGMLMDSCWFFVVHLTVHRIKVVKLMALHGDVKIVIFQRFVKCNT